MPATCTHPEPVISSLYPDIPLPEYPIYNYLAIVACVSTVFFFPQDIPNKQILWTIIFSRTNNYVWPIFYLFSYLLFVSLSLSLSLSQSHSNFQYTDPIMHTAYIYSHIHIFQYISITQLALYISSVWLPQNLPMNSIGLHIQLYSSMYACFQLASLSRNFIPNTPHVQFSTLKNFR